MTAKEKLVVDGVENAFGCWIEQHSYATMPECIIEAVGKSFAKWLDENRDEVIAAIADRAFNKDLPL